MKRNGKRDPWLPLVLLAACTGCAGAAPDTFPVVQTEGAFLDACEQEHVQRVPAAASWARDECQVKWRWAVAAGPLAEAILTLSRTRGEAPRAPADAKVLLSGVDTPADVEVVVDAAGIQFRWQEPGSEGRYNVTGALRSRGVVLESLGCPQYPGASMGREKVMLAEFPGREPFVLSIYSRGAPTGIEPGVYEVAADFSGTVPDMTALRAGDYPGGGGRAFAVDPTGWVADCPDPE